MGRGRGRRAARLVLAAALALGVWTVVGLERVRVAPWAEPSRAALWAALSPAERHSIEAGQVRFLDGRAACRLAAAGAPPSDEFLVILNTPAVFRPKGSNRPGRTTQGGPAARGERTLAVTQAAVRLGARLMVDCTDADLARLTPDGWRSVLLAKRAGIWRMVVFDGAHHLAALAADPELLLLPSLPAGGEDLVVHGYVRDALPLSALRRALDLVGAEPAAVTVPRFSLPLKENLPLRLAVLQALRRLGQDAGGGRGSSRVHRPRLARPGRRLPVEAVVLRGGAAYLPGGTVLAAEPVEAPSGLVILGLSHGVFSFRDASAPVRRPPPRALGLGWPVSVWDLLLRYPGTLVGQKRNWAASVKYVVPD